MQMIRRLLIGAMSVVGVVACIAAAILLVNRYRSESLPDTEDFRATAWENLGATFDFELPPDLPESPGIARVVDPDLADTAGVRDVIDEELHDASAEEREIWRTELAQHSPQEIREILGIHRRLSPTLGHARVGDVEFLAADAPAPQPLPEGEVASANRIPNDAPLFSGPRVAADAPVSADALRLIESAIEAAEAAEQVILNNIANANTIGFKRSRPLFGELPYREVRLAAQTDAEGKTASTGIALGNGVRLTATQADHSPGRLRHTQRPLDVAIQGEGYFQINDGDRFVYTRTGTFALNASGEIVLISKDRSRPLEPTIKVPADTAKLVISSTGSVSVLQAGQVQLSQIGQLQLCRFVNPEALAACGENLFERTDASGNPTITSPGEAGLGELRQGALEESNVVAIDELADVRRMQEHLKTLRQLRADLAGTSHAP